MMAYFAALDPMTLIRALPGNVAQGLIWGIMALGVYITFRILDFADLTVDGTLATGGAVAVMLIQGGMHPAAYAYFFGNCRDDRGTCDRALTYRVGDSRDSGKHIDPDIAVFNKFEDHGKGESEYRHWTERTGGFPEICIC